MTVLVGFLSTFGVLKKTTKKDTKKARKEPPDEEKVPAQETAKVFIENEMTTSNTENVEDAKTESSEAVKTEPGEAIEKKEMAIESQEEESMAETAVETSTPVQVEAAAELEETKEKDNESQESDVKGENSETSTAVEDEQTKGKDVESQEEKPMSQEEVEKGREEEKGDGKSRDDKKESETEPAKTNVEEDFLVTAAICSTWIPTVVGDQTQKIYLKAGMAYLIKIHILILSNTQVSPVWSPRQPASPSQSSWRDAEYTRSTPSCCTASTRPR